MNLNNNAELLIEILQISEQLESTFKYLMPIVKDISARSVNSMLSQEIKSDIQSLRFMMDNKLSIFQNFKHTFENNLMQICNHEWITDYIDISEYESQKIVYCEYCKLTKP